MLTRVQRQVETLDAMEEEERAGWLAREEERQRLLEACGRILGELAD